MAAVGGNTGNQVVRSVLSDGSNRARGEDDSGKGRASRFQAEVSTKTTTGLKAKQGGHQDHKDVDKKQVKARTAQKSDHVDHRGAQHGRTSDPARGGHLPANIVSQPVPAEVTRLQLAGGIDYPWQFNSHDIKFFQLAAGLGGYRRSQGTKSYNAFLTNVMTNIVAHKTIKNDSEFFAEMIVLQTMKWDKSKQYDFNLNKLEGTITAIDRSLTRPQRESSIITRLGNADSKSTIIKGFHRRMLSDTERADITALIYREAVSRFSKGVLGYLQQKKNEALGDTKSLTVSAGKGLERREGNIRYTTTGVQMLDNDYCHHSVFKCLEDFCKDIKIKHTYEWIKKKNSGLPITVDSFKDLCSDLDKIAKHELTQSRYDQENNKFIPPTNSQKDLEGACRRFLRGGSHKLSDSALIELIPCYLQAKKYRTKFTDNVDTLLNSVLATEARKGAETALKVWNSCTPHEIYLMGHRIVEHSMVLFMKAKGAFTEELKINETDQKDTKVAVDALKVSSGKKGKKGDADLMNAVLRDAQRRDTEEESIETARDDEYFGTRMQTGGASSESREGDQNLAVSVCDPGARSRFMESFKAQSDKKEAFKSKGSPKDIGIKTLDDRFITKDLVRGLRDFVNAFADFQPQAKKKYLK